MTNGIGPARERIALLDALRGFALFGILLVNIEDWSGWSALAEQNPALGKSEGGWWYKFFRTTVLEGKFYTIFSFMFGLGFALQLSRLSQRGANGVAIYRRRVLVLLAIGVIHMTLIWEGDILTLYAILGLLLPLLHGWSDRALVRGAIILLLLPIPGYALVHALSIQPDLGLDLPGNWIFQALGGELGAEKGWRARQDWGSLAAWNLSGLPFRIGSFFESWRIPKVLALMMLGLWAGRRLVGGRLLEDQRLLRHVVLWGLLIGIPANIGYGLIGGLEQDEFIRGLAATALYAIGVVPLGLAYAAGFVLLWGRASKVLGVLAWPGRMALTNYLMHSILGVVIFYGIGFGLFATLPPLGFLGIGLAIYVAQIAFSRFWLQHFAQGPMERLWRRLTYGARDPGMVSLPA